MIWTFRGLKNGLIVHFMPQWLCINSRFEPIIPNVMCWADCGLMNQDAALGNIFLLLMQQQPNSCSSEAAYIS